MKRTLFEKARFVASAFDSDSFPKMTALSGNPMPEIALIGRSNVGKSSLINHLLNNKKLAKVSSTPGKTQSVNFFSIDDQLALVDLPGYGYAKASKEVRSRWSEVIDAYLHNRATLRLLLLLIDSRREPTEEDLCFIEWAKQHQKPLLLILTKADKREENKKPPFKNFIHYSIKDARGRMEVISKINAALKDYGTHQ